MPDYKEMYLIMVRAAEQAQNILTQRSKSARKCISRPTTRRSPDHGGAERRTLFFCGKTPVGRHPCAPPLGVQCVSAAAHTGAALQRSYKICVEVGVPDDPPASRPLAPPPPRTALSKPRVIANQCAHWCGNPYSPAHGTI